MGHVQNSLSQHIAASEVIEQPAIEAEFAEGRLDGCEIKH